MAAKKTTKKKTTAKKTTKKATTLSLAHGIRAKTSDALKLEKRAAERDGDAELWAGDSKGESMQRVAIIDADLAAHIKGGGEGRYHVKPAGADEAGLVELEATK